MPKIFTSPTQKTGELGENIAVRFLMKRNFSILDRNYTKKWGEIDIVAEKNNVLYFVEVKSVVRENLNYVNLNDDFPLPASLQTSNGYDKAMSEKRETLGFRPEENMHPWKIKRLNRTIQTYLSSERISENKKWQMDLLIVYLDIKNKKAKVKVIGNIIL